MSIVQNTNTNCSNQCFDSNKEFKLKFTPSLENKNSPSIILKLAYTKLYVYLSIDEQTPV